MPKRSCSKQVVDRMTHTQNYNRVTLECGYEMLVNYNRPHYICAVCQVAKDQQRSHLFNIVLATPHGFLLTTDRFFKPLEQCDRDCLQRFTDSRTAQKYGVTLGLSISLEPRHLPSLMDELAA